MATDNDDNSSQHPERASTRLAQIEVLTQKSKSSTNPQTKMSNSKRGKLIVFEGLDRAGKTTQCAKLVENLRAQGRSVKVMRFPGTNFHEPVKVLVKLSMS